MSQIPVEQYNSIQVDKDRIITAIVQATKNSVKRMKHSLVIKLLKALREKRIGTNEVEFSVNKRANDGPPHHRASLKYLYQHKDTILCQPSVILKKL